MAPTEILPGLFLGDIVDAAAWMPGVGAQKKQALISVLEGLLGTPLGPFQYQVPLLGTGGPALVSRASLAAVAAMLNCFRNENWKVLVHCGAGIERSPLAVAWYMANSVAMDYYQANGIEPIFTIDGAYKFIISKRPQVADRQQWIAPE